MSNNYCSNIYLQVCTHCEVLLPEYATVTDVRYVIDLVYVMLVHPFVLGVCACAPAERVFCKEYVSLIIGLYKNNGSVLHVAIRLLYFWPLYPARIHHI